MPEYPTSKDFAAHLNTIFRVESPAVLALELAEVNDRSNAAVEQFSVFFKGPVSPFLQQGTYTLQHAEMREVALFLVPLGPREGQMLYEAVFSRLAAAKRPAPDA